MLVKLKNVDVNSLRTLFDRTLCVSNSLDFRISSEAIKSSVSNEDQNFWKNWGASTKGLFESEPFNEIKVLFSNGHYFKNKFLGLFGNQKCDVNITCNDAYECESIEFIGATSFGSALKVNMRSTRYDLAKDALSEDIYEKLFDENSVITTFDVDPQVISEINKLRGLNAMADQPTAYVTFKGGDGIIKAFDSSFEFVISEYDGVAFEAKFPKKSLSFIDHEGITISYCKNSEFEFDWFVITGKYAMVESKSCAMLMTSMIDANDDIDDNIFGDDAGW